MKKKKKKLETLREKTVYDTKEGGGGQAPRS